MPVCCWSRELGGTRYIDFKLNCFRVARDPGTTRKLCAGFVNPFRLHIRNLPSDLPTNRELERFIGSVGHRPRSCRHALVLKVEDWYVRSGETPHLCL